MDATNKRMLQEQKNIKKVKLVKDNLISEGCYPKIFSRPVNLQLELTSNCNCRCKHCYNRSGGNHAPDLMTPERWKKFCLNLVENGGILQSTISGGEPLLLGDNLWDIMDILHNDGTIFNLITNGYLFNQNVLEHVKRYRFYWVQFSIDNFISDFHDKFRGVAGIWRRVAEAAYKTALSGIPVRIASTITPRDINNLEKFVQMAINLGASYYIIGEVIPSGRAFDNPDIMLSEADRNIFYSEMDRLVKKYKKEITILMSGSQRTQLEYAATGAIDGAIIRPDGNIRLDCDCPFVIGNVLKDNIFEVWKEKSNCWQHPSVKKYIESCDPISGKNSYMGNYNQDDILL